MFLGVPFLDRLFVSRGVFAVATGLGSPVVGSTLANDTLSFGVSVGNVNNLL